MIILLNRYYLSSYLKQKGENLATKEDVGDIAHKIEAVRVQYASELEHLRTRLHVTASEQSAFMENQRKALLSFFDDCVTLLGVKISESPGDLPFDQGRSLLEYQSTVMKLFSKVYLDYHRLILYFGPESGLLTAASEILTSSRDTRAAFRKHFGKVKMALIEEENALSSGKTEAIQKAVKDTNEVSNEYWKRMAHHIKRMQSAFEKYLVALNNHLRTTGSSRIPDLVAGDQ